MVNKNGLCASPSAMLKNGGHISTKNACNLPQAIGCKA